MKELPYFFYSYKKKTNKRFQVQFETCWFWNWKYSTYDYYRRFVGKIINSVDLITSSNTMREHKNEYVEIVQQYTAVTLSNNDTKIRGIITLFTITINIEFLLKPDEGRLYFSWHEGKK